MSDNIANPGGGGPGAVPDLPPEDLERLRQFRTVRPVPPERPRGTWVGKVFLVGLLAVGGYGGYYGYCRYKVGDLEHAMSHQATRLNQALMHVDGGIVPEDIRKVVRQMARKAGVEVDEPALKVSIEPMGPDNMGKLSAVARTALGIAAKMKNHTRPQWVVGFHGRFMARHGVAKASFELERFTYFQYVKSATD